MHPLPVLTCAMIAARQVARSSVLLPPAFAPVSSSMPGCPSASWYPPSWTSLAWTGLSEQLASSAGLHTPLSFIGGAEALLLVLLALLAAAASNVGRQKVQPGGAAEGCVAAAKPASTSSVESASKKCRKASQLDRKSSALCSSTTLEASDSNFAPVQGPSLPAICCNLLTQPLFSLPPYEPQSAAALASAR